MKFKDGPIIGLQILCASRHSTVRGARLTVASKLMQVKEGCLVGVILEAQCV